MNPENADIRPLLPDEVDEKISQVNHKSEIATNLQSKPTYLGSMRLVADIFAVVGIFSIIITAFTALMAFLAYTRGDRNSNFVWFIVSFAATLQCFIFFGILKAVADIAENMVDVGNYVRQLKAENSNKTTK
jgi:hypothetical protein